MVNRRGFFGTIGALVAGLFAPKVATAPTSGLLPGIYSTPTTGTYDAIDRATYSFWRNQQVAPGSAVAFDALTHAMRDITGISE